jgi:WD40 repeat protein
LDEERLRRAARPYHDRFLEFTPDGASLITEEVGGRGILRIDASDFRELARNTNAFHALGLAVDRKSLQVIDPSSRVLSRLSLPSLELVPGSQVVLETNGLPTGRPMWMKDGPASGVFAVHFPNGNIRAWDSATGRQFPPPERPSACDCDFWILPNGRLATVGEGFAVELYEARTGRRMARLEGHRAPPSAVDLSPDGTLLATSDEGGELILWDAHTFRRRNQIREFDLIGRLRFSGDGRTLLVGDSRRLQFLNLESLRVAGSVPVESLVHTTLAVAPGDVAVALLGRDNQLRVWPAAHAAP